jgi:hypothetical protein
MEALQRAEYDAKSLMAEHPPQLHDRNKQLVFDIAMPAGSGASGVIGYSRWPTMSLPAAVDFQAHEPAIDVRGGYFDCAPVLEPGEGLEWHLNFADSELFGYYGGPLFAQDEMQVAEHPVLASVREALLWAGWPARTVEARQPTPVLVTGAERRCSVATDANAAEGRPQGLYGNAFSHADREAITRATTRLDPPSISNILAIAAPSPGFGVYERSEIESILVTAFSGFRAAAMESRRTAGEGSKVATPATGAVAPLAAIARSWQHCRSWRHGWRGSIGSCSTPARPMARHRCRKPWHSCVIWAMSRCQRMMSSPALPRRTSSGA